MTTVRSWVAGGAMVIGISLSGTSPAYAMGGEFAAGFQAGCLACLQIGIQAQNIIRQSIQASQKTLYSATGENTPGGQVGFPMLERTIKQASEKQTANLRDAFDTAGQRISQELRQVPFTKAKIDSEQLNGAAAPNYDPTTEQEVKRSVGRDPDLPSAMSAIESLLRGDRALAPLNDDDSASEDDKSDERGNIKNLGNPDAARTAQIHSLTEALRENDGSTFAELNAGLLVEDRNRILGDKAVGDDEYSQQQKADLYLQLLAGKETSSARATLNGDNLKSLAGLRSAVNQNINDMGKLTLMQVMDHYAQMRRLHPKGYGLGAYMRKSMPNAAVVMGNTDRFDVNGDEKKADLMSDEAFMALTSAYRSRSPSWMAKVAADGDYAAREATMIAAERLYVKYQRLKAKREINMMLAMLLGKQLQTEEPGNVNR
ncbi:hypothetical protein EZI54_07240 [Marinobacter halodurans]|uniref:Uncharacterized protein n=1 Tax=Marinobacter halodurans TaxID=2528979 RepID=A0ABY1ZR42_9GAMM|nr:hypothetical protein [Marinobacter halodurans]TBW57446.1 hypothetical protein EZI54_07240 [Marinobacter halodurans]